MSYPDHITLTRPDDWHLHLRDGDAMRAALAHSARQFGRAIIMPNLKPPVDTVDKARAYRQRLRAALPAGSDFEPLMTLYLTPNTTIADIRAARECGWIHGVKLYPAGATTHSDAGVGDLQPLYPVLEAMAEYGLPLLVHGEVTAADVDVFDREAVFIERQLKPLTTHIAELKVVLEHITTQQAVEFVRAAPEHIAATITAHHLLMNRNAMFQGGIRPHHYCLPILKREVHRQALVRAATSGEKKFFLGTDSAPHGRTAKESACGCAGIYTAHAALELYAEAFEQAGALDRLEAFASFHGADFYGLPRNNAQVTLRREAWQVPASYPFGDDTVVPLRAGQTLQWRLTAGT